MKRTSRFAQQHPLAIANPATTAASIDIFFMSCILLFRLYAAHSAAFSVLYQRIMPPVALDICASGAKQRIGNA
jgi:hypothetical protein